jgi:VWFA-related protein
MGALALAQQPVSESAPPRSSLRITARAVLVDVIVTDSSGNPVTGLARDAFTASEQGRRQAISFFEEHGSGPQMTAEMPKLPAGVFTNFSPFPQPPAVNVILLDSLNTRMENQSVVHSQAMKFLMSAKPGTRSAIFVMGLSLKFVQGFNDDPAVLAAALRNQKNNEVEDPVMLKSQAETNVQERVVAMGAAGLAHLFAEMDAANEEHRKLLTLANLQQLATFLQGFSGRKNIIWFAEKAPGVFNPVGTTGDPAIEDETKKTLAMLGAARAALYPVDARGTAVNAQYTAENNPVAVNTAGQAIAKEDRERNTDQINAQILAEQSGGRAFANTNGLSEVLDKVTSESSHFYTLAYAPTNPNMDGGWRKIDVKVTGGRYSLSYRRGYFAVDTDHPGSTIRNQNRNAAAQSDGVVDPLLPFMDLGMPQSQQILYEAKIQTVPVGDQVKPGDPKGAEARYTVDFAVDAKDLKLPQGPDGVRTGTLNISLIAYDRYGNVVSRKDHIVQLNVKPDVWAV